MGIKGSLSLFLVLRNCSSILTNIQKHIIAVLITIHDVLILSHLCIKNVLSLVSIFEEGVMKRNLCKVSILLAGLLFASYSQPALAGFPSYLPRMIEATGRTVFIYNPHIMKWGAYDEDGKLVKIGRGSGGRDYCPDIGHGCKSPSGIFHVYSKAGPYYRSNTFPIGEGGAPMPYAMFFQGGYAIHGSYDVPNFNASHGCIRVTPYDAQWLNLGFLEQGSLVVVYPY
jgi:hypothetical protein